MPDDNLRVVTADEGGAWDLNRENSTDEQIKIKLCNRQTVIAALEIEIRFKKIEW